ncbi:MAG: DUF421 domain-containing protein [Clostridia bacterium]|nr:DUF421 domain-containing protein [Clostridia bacterium]
MVTIFLRTIFIYLSLVVVMRLMGKRQLGELEVTDLVTTLFISEIASLPVTNLGLPISHAIVPIVILLALEVISSVLLIKFPKLKLLVSAQPTVIIQDGKLLQDALRGVRISLEELMAEIRQSGYVSFSQIQYAIVEKNGKLTILPKAAYAPPDAKELGLAPQEIVLSHIVYANDSFSKEGLALIGKDRAWLEAELKKHDLSKETLLFVTADKNGELFYVTREDRS